MVKVNGHITPASRWVFQQLHDITLPTAVQVRHRCDNPPCVNWRHLLPGSAADNSRDMVERGRHRNGSAWVTIIPARVVENILLDRIIERATYRELGERYGVSDSYVHKIVNGLCRREITSRWVAQSAPDSHGEMT
jgi:hypothetical protein